MNVQTVVQHVRYDCADGVATITLDDPKRRNALSRELTGELLDALARARRDDEARCVVLASSHATVWCAGGDLAAFKADAPLIHKHFDHAVLPELIDALMTMPKPTLCAASGHVLAGGLGVALACDMVLAKDTATFGTPEINVGIFPFMIAALIFRNVPRKLANELLMLGDRLTAEQAREAGFVNRVAPAGDFDALVADWAQRLAAKSPLLMRMGKESVRRQMDMSLDDALDYLRAQLSLAVSTDDIVEGVTAFFEQRTPVWSGR